MSAFANLAAKELPDIFFPEADYQISAIAPKLRGVLPQNREEDITPEDWYFAKK
jgi:hypothetical protein